MGLFYLNLSPIFPLSTTAKTGESAQEMDLRLRRVQVDGERHFNERKRHRVPRAVAKINREMSRTEDQFGSFKK